VRCNIRSIRQAQRRRAAAKPESAQSRPSAPTSRAWWARPTRRGRVPTRHDIFEAANRRALLSDRSLVRLGQIVAMIETHQKIHQILSSPRWDQIGRFLGGGGIGSQIDGSSRSRSALIYYFEQKMERRHDRARRSDLRIEQMQVLPFPAWLAGADIFQVRSGAHRAHQMRPVENIVPSHRSSRSPAPLNIRSKIGGPYLLAMAVKAAFRNVHFAPQ